MDVPDNFTINLLESTWTPYVLTLASILHFLLSAVLIVSYCYLQVTQGSQGNHGNLGSQP